MAAGVLTFALAAVFAACPTAIAQAAAPLLDEMFQDHAVLQRERELAVWGRAAPDDQVTLTFNGQTVSAAADAAGRWTAKLAPMKAGGPYALEVSARSGARQSVGDVMVGDVYLCSGQSNMEWPVRQANSNAMEIARSANPRIRMLTAPQTASPAAREDFMRPVTWQVAGPQTTGAFSAACYYFARELQKTVDAPLGLIHSSWGGTRIEPWIAREGYKGRAEFAEPLALLDAYAADPADGQRRMGARWETWWRKAAPDAGEPWKPGAPGPWTLVPAMTNWKTWGAPETATLNGMIWYRREVALTEAQAAQGASLALGGIDEVDETWVNGVAIGNTFGWGSPRTYDVPAGVLKPGLNTIVVSVTSTFDAGGMLGPADKQALTFADASVIPLGGDWTYRLGQRGIGDPPRAPWEAIGGLTTLNNAMIAPVGPYGLKGALWYQGESNSGATNYEAQLHALMASWRAQFGADLPVLIVQLPNYGAAPTRPTQSGWSIVREAQRRAVLNDTRSALVVTIDAGENDDLHPQNKQVIGARLARAARGLIYGEAISPSGPEALAARREGKSIRVSFKPMQDKLVLRSSARPIALELCGETQTSCRYADARLDGDAILIASDGRAATRVRYCWGDGPLCNIYDAAGMPAGPFELMLQ